MGGNDTDMQSMSLEEARSVLWLRNNPRPLGELLDKGYLNKRRLQWAAERAYDPRLRAAATVLLKHLENEEAVRTVLPDSPPAIAARISVEQARCTPWPFKPFKGELMGRLVDAQRLSLKDLVYAIENAWDERVRQAAIVLLALRLNQIVQEPPPPAGLLKVISGGRSFSERKQLQWVMIEGMVLGLLMAGMIWAGGYSIAGIVRATSSPRLTPLLTTPTGVVAFILALIFLFAVGALLVWPLNLLMDLGFKKLEREIENYRKGQEGEERVVELMRQNLDGKWTLLRNLVIPGRKRADIDAVLVGPLGVWVLEIKTFGGQYRNFGEHWEVLTRQGWKPLRKSPSRQAKDNAVRISHFLEVAGIHQWVEPVVVWADPESNLVVENPAVAVWNLDHLPEELGNLRRDRMISEEMRVLIVEKLATLCRRLENSEQNMESPQT